MLVAMIIEEWPAWLKAMQKCKTVPLFAPKVLTKMDKERGRNNFPNYASQLQATFARFQITKTLK